MVSAAHRSLPNDNTPLNSDPIQLDQLDPWPPKPHIYPYMENPIRRLDTPYHRLDACDHYLDLDAPDRHLVASKYRLDLEASNRRLEACNDYLEDASVRRLDASDHHLDASDRHLDDTHDQYDDDRSNEHLAETPRPFPLIRDQGSKDAQIWETEKIDPYKRDGNSLQIHA